jgi:outer membrane protein assembly factor BamB
MKKIKLHLIIYILCLSLNISGQQDTVQKWLHFGSDYGYTGFVANEHTITKSNVNKLKRIWGIGCDDGGFSVISRAPAILENRLFVANAGGKLSSYNATNGQFNWDFGLNNDGWAKQPTVSSDSTVYYLQGSWPSYLYAVNGKNGEMLWEAPRGFKLYYDDKNIITVDETSNQLFLMDQDPTTLYAIDRFTGLINWTFFEDNDTMGLSFQPYISLSTNNLLMVEGKNSSNYNRLIEINSVNPALMKKYPWVRFNALSSILAMDTLAALAYNNADSCGVMIFNRNSLQQVYKFRFPSEITGSLAFNPKTNILYIPTNPYLYAYDLSTGSLKWKYTVPAYDSIYSPTIANGVIYFISNTKMWAIDEETKENLFNFELGGDGYDNTQVAVYNGRLYFSGNGYTCDFFCLGLTAPKLDQMITFNLIPPKTYGDTDIDPGATISSDLTVSYESSDTNIATIVNGMIHITGAGLSNVTAFQEGDSTYNAANDVVQSLNVNKKDLTVTADSKTRNYGDVNPEFIISYNGFVNGDEASCLDIVPTATTLANTSSLAGDHTITVSGGSDNNYAFTYVNGTLTITPVTGVNPITKFVPCVYPNPFTDKITISTECEGTGKYTLTSIIGNVFEEDAISSNRTTICLSYLKSGVYLLCVTINGKTQNFRIVKQ